VAGVMLVSDQVGSTTIAKKVSIESLSFSSNDENKNAGNTLPAQKNRKKIALLESADSDFE
jgi:hypothetical protein